MFFRSKLVNRLILVIYFNFGEYVLKGKLKQTLSISLKRIGMLVLLFVAGPLLAEDRFTLDEKNSRQSVTEIKVTFIINSYPGFSFWDNQAKYAQAVADALDINLSIVYIPQHQADRFGVVTFFNEYLQQLNKPPDLIISALWLGAELNLLELLNNMNIPLISINTALSERHFELLGKPREKYPLWLAHFSTNDKQAGYELSEYLLAQIEHNQSQSKSKKINLFAFAGTAYTSASQQRVAGLKQSITEHKNALLFNVVNANWDRELTYSMMQTVLDRHNNIDAYWVLGDIMAMGVLDGLKEGAKKPYPLIGSMDWSAEIIEHIERGDVAVSFGGHFMEAGYALSMYADYKRVADFAGRFGTIYYTSLAKLDRNNLELLGDFLRHPKWNREVIRANNLFFNPNLKNYVVAPEKIIQLHIEANKN